jgi:hypothetical protein
MKLTNDQLIKIIKEELENVINEQPKTLRGSITVPDGSINRYNIRLEDEYGVGIFSARIPLPGSPNAVELAKIISDLPDLPSHISFDDIKNSLEKGSIYIPQRMQDKIQNNF